MAKHICIVEDNDAFRSALVDLLKKSGYSVSGFINGLEAIAVLDKTKFDLVISDVDMPEMTGLELAQCIQDKARHTPVILMSGACALERYEWGAGVTAFLRKPFGAKELLNQITEALSPVTA